MEQPDRTSLALRVLLTATFLGIVGDLLLKGASWSMNFAVFVLLCLVAGVWLYRHKQEIPQRSALFFAVPIALFGLLFVWRDSVELKVANSIGLVLAAGAMAVRSRQGQIWLGSIVDYSFNSVGAWIASPVYAGFLVCDDIKWKERAGWVKNGKAAAITRGLALAIPTVFVFGGLFASADARFRNVFETSFSIDGEDLFLHALTMGLIAAVVGGLLRAIFLSSSEKLLTPPPAPPGEPIRIGITEIGTVLGSTILVFALFVGVQFTHFFGGHDLVQTTAGLTYAEHARRGFFELVTVAAITLPMLLIMHSVLDRREARHERIFFWMARILVGLLFVVMASAMQRMWGYVEAYGLTTLRLYTTAFMIWLGLCFVWLLVTQLNGRPQRFAFGAVVAGFLTIMSLNILNPDATIARVNIAMGGNAVDVEYLASLSADAVPTLYEALPRLASGQREELSSALAYTWSEPIADWREFNFGRAAAIETVGKMNQSSGQG